MNTTSTSSTLQCKDIDYCRTLQNIIFGCASTVFLCTWTALHLNVPKEPDKLTWLKATWIRVTSMLGALVAPEIVFLIAFIDWTNSSEMLKKILDRFPKCGWTSVHAQFARMGGFRLKDTFDGNTDLLYEEAFFDYVKEGWIDLPRVSEAEILGRSKGDPIAKSITIMQTAWFVVQCIHRRSQHLLITQLEITTLGHTLINFFIYFFWWRKPLGVAFPIDVPYKGRRPERNSMSVERLDNNAVKEKESSDRNHDIQLPRTIGIEEKPTQLSCYAQLGIKTYSVSHLEGLSQLGRLILSVVYFVLGSAFGAIHCLAWNTQFPTRVEQIMWQLSSLVVAVIGGTAVGIVINFSRISRFVRDGGRAGTFVGFITIVIVIPLYLLARICLLLVALLQLRALPYAAYVTPSWTMFYPHIS